MLLIGIHNFFLFYMTFFPFILIFSYMKDDFFLVFPNAHLNLLFRVPLDSEKMIEVKKRIICNKFDFDFDFGLTLFFLS